MGIWVETGVMRVGVEYVLEVVEKSRGWWWCMRRWWLMRWRERVVSEGGGGVLFVRERGSKE